MSLRTVSNQELLKQLCLCEEKAQETHAKNIQILEESIIKKKQTLVMFAASAELDALEGSYKF